MTMTPNDTHLVSYLPKRQGNLRSARAGLNLETRQSGCLTPSVLEAAGSRCAIGKA